MDTAFTVVAAFALILTVTTFLAWRQRNERRDLALLASLTGISGAGAGLLWLT